MTYRLTRLFTALALAAALPLVGCEEDPETPPVSTAVPPVVPPPVVTPMAGGAPPVPPPQPAVPPTPPPVMPPPVMPPPAAAAATFTQVVDDVFAKSCSNFMSCHDSDMPAFGLDLETDPYNAIVNVTAIGTALPLVAPGDPDGSYLYQKIVQDMPAAGGRMPPGGGELSAERIEIIRSWIEAGAQM